MEKENAQGYLKKERTIWGAIIRQIRGQGSMNSGYLFGNKIFKPGLNAQLGDIPFTVTL